MITGSEQNIIDRTQDLITLNMTKSNGDFDYTQYASEGVINVDVGMGKWFKSSVFSGSENESKHTFNTLTRKRKYK